MRNHSITIAALLMTTALVAMSCEKQESSGTYTDTAHGEPPVDTNYQIDGIPAETFYKQMSYRKEGDGPTPYRYLQSDWLFEEGTRTGENVYLRMSLFLQDQRNYVFVYEEALGTEIDDVITIKKKTFRKAFKGKWAMDHTDLRLADTAIVSGLRNNGHPAASVQLISDINIDGVKGLTLMMSYRGNKESIDDLQKRVRDEEDFAWLYGKWRRVSQPNEFIAISPTEVRREFDRLINGAPCRYAHISHDYETGSQIVVGQFHYTVTYRVDGVEPVGNPSNPSCAQFIEKDRVELPARPLGDTFEFARNGDKLIFSADGGNYQRD